jgi:hypothetical protein
MKWLTFACKARDALYFPSSFQLTEYCKREEYKKCPFLLRNTSFSEERLGYSFTAQHL